MKTIVLIDTSLLIAAIAKVSLATKKKTLVTASDDTRSSKLLCCLIHPIAKG